MCDDLAKQYTLYAYFYFICGCCWIILVLDSALDSTSVSGFDADFLLRLNRLKNRLEIKQLARIECEKAEMNNVIKSVIK